MFIVQVNDKEGVLKELVHVGTDLEVATTKFLGACETNISNWDEYDPDDKSAILDDGYETFGNGAIVLIDTSSCVSDDDIRDQLTHQPGENVTVAEIIQDGEIELAEGMTIGQIDEQCAGNLNRANSWDIQGQILFKGSDGRWYTITTESIVSEASPEFVRDTLAENENV